MIIRADAVYNIQGILKYNAKDQFVAIVTLVGVIRIDIRATELPKF